MANIYDGKGREITCGFCGTGTRNLKRLVRDPSKGQGRDDGPRTSTKICEECREQAKQKDPAGWERRIESGRYTIKDL